MTLRAKPDQQPISLAGSNDLSLPAASTLLHSVVLRPPILLWDGRRYTGPVLGSVDVESARQVPGVVEVVVVNNFIGVIASQALQATHARTQIHAQWLNGATPAIGTSIDAQTRATPRETRPHPAGGNHPAVAGPHYSWPLPDARTTAWAIAHFTDATLNVWTSCARPDLLKAEISLLCNVSAEAVVILPNGQPEANGHDVAVDAALLARHCKRPVRVREESAAAHDVATLELYIQPTGTTSQDAHAAPHPDSDAAPKNGAQSASPSTNAYTLSTNRHGLRRPSIAALLCGYEYEPQPSAVSVATHYTTPGFTLTTSHNSTAIDAAPDSPQAPGIVFASESFVDELFRAQNCDPVQARLENINDATGRNLIRAVAEKANWNETPRSGHGKNTGKGFAYAHIVDNSGETPQQVWSAWAAEVCVDPETGTIDLTRLTVGHNTEALQHGPDSPEQLKNRVRDTATRLLHGPDNFDSWGASAQDDSDSHAVSLPKVELVAQGADQALNTELSWNRHADLPAAAAIANAIFDATGVRFRQPPFDTQSLKSRLAKTAAPYRKFTYALLGGIAAAVAGFAVSAMPWRLAMTPLTNIDTSIYSAAAINRGRLVAAAGDCMVCHTAEGGQKNVGGRALDTPFGTVYTTNITPDKKTGIGTWSYAAFERAMRQGIHQDGRLLYPAFPYTDFAKITDPDMQALYAYLMTQEPIESTPPATKLAFPFNMRPLLAGWNLMFHRNQVYKPDPTQSTLWNRGAYLVQGAGHCAACHSPRNSLGAEKIGEKDFLGGGFADGWEAPALNTLSKAPIAWTEDALYDYLRTGYSSLHGVASGPMTPVIQSLGELPDSDVRAVAHYLASLNPPIHAKDTPAMQAARLEDSSRRNPAAMTHPGENLFEGACAVCHDARGGPPLFGSRPSLALNSNLHSGSPDNVIQVLLHGIENPAAGNLGTMPGFGQSMNNQQLETLIAYMRLRFAPNEPAWTGLDKKIAALRNTPQ
jgi:nicotinate dehydrogenase subunit B